MWGMVAIAACAAMASASAEKETGITTVAMGAPSRPKEAVTGKCPCCGSRQFVTHQSRRVCSYCRSEQDGQALKPALMVSPKQIEGLERYYERLGYDDPPILLYND